MKLWETFVQAYNGYASYLWNEITFRNEGGFWHNYFWMLVAVSAFFLILEWIKPWRKDQPRFRKDFWMDFFYMFFNFFIFSLIIYNASSTVVVELFNTGIKKLTGFDLSASNPMMLWPSSAVLLTGFVVRDFVQWWTHRLLHRSERLWEFHKVHHSVEQMGFAAHLRYHWMETIVYRTIEYIPLALLGVGLHDFFLIHIFTLAWGHYNHANIKLPGWLTGGITAALFTTYALTVDLQLGVWQTALAILPAFGAGALILGPFMKKLFNSPEMHIWHHSYELPKGYHYGINFGITLAIWDYIFGTAVIPHDGRDIRLGFEGIEEFPEDFGHQLTYGFGKNQSKH